MKRNIFYFLVAFLFLGLIAGGAIWGLTETGKIQVNTESTSELKTIDIDELVRLLIPDKGENIEREDIFAKLEKWLEWDSLSLHTNVWRGKYTVSSNGKVPMILKEKLEPWKWNVYILGDGPEYGGFCFLGMCMETPDDFDFENLFKLKKGDYADEDEHKYQFNGKIPVWLHSIEDRSNGRDIYNLTCYFNPEKRRFIGAALLKQLKKDYPFMDDDD